MYYGYVCYRVFSPAISQADTFYYTIISLYRVEEQIYRTMLKQ